MQESSVVTTITMMLASIALLSTTLLTASLLARPVLAATPASTEHVKDVLTVRAALQRLAEQDIWPGFDPTIFPLAVYDGSRTWLFQHPVPSAEFSPSTELPGASVSDGRHPAMRWNSNADIGGTMTATILLTIDPERSAAEEAALIIHETFHLFQRHHAWPWRPNELHKLTYPVTDAANYRLTIEEDHALVRALRALQENDAETAARWAARAMAARSERLLQLDEDHRDFELGIEVWEGTAFYLAHKVIGDEAGTIEKLLDTLPPGELRWRPYATGGAVAVLLGRFAPQWRARFDAAPDLRLDTLLVEAFEQLQPEPIEFTRKELAGFRRQAAAAVAEIEKRRTAQRARFNPDSHDGWLVSVEVPNGGEPFSLNGWDPITLLSIGDGQVVHGKQLALGCPAGSISMTNPGFKRRELVGLNALTRVRSGHPVVGEIVAVVFSGFNDRPRIGEDVGRVTVRADGLEIDLAGALLRVQGKFVEVTLAPSQQ